MPNPSGTAPSNGSERPQAPGGRADATPGRARVSANERPLVVSYLTLRKSVGCLGIAFPVILPLGCRASGGCVGLESSLSEYYGTDMRDVFVGVLFAIGLFLFAYRGYSSRDEIAGKLASGFAVGVALFPVTSPFPAIRDTHYASAASFFLTLSYFSLVLFTKTDQAKPARRKRMRNAVYRACGITILVCIALIAMFEVFGQATPLAKGRPVFWLESVALWAFGIAWITKGEAILKD